MSDVPRERDFDETPGEDKAPDVPAPGEETAPTSTDSPAEQGDQGQDAMDETPESGDDEQAQPTQDSAGEEPDVQDPARQSPARPTNRHREQNLVGPSAGEPPSWFLDDEASRPDAPSPSSWMTPPFHDPRPPGPRWEQRERQEKHEARFSKFGIILVAASIVVAGVVIGLGMALSGSVPTAQPTAQPSSAEGSASTSSPSKSVASPSAEATSSTSSPAATPSGESMKSLPPADGSLNPALQSNPLYALPAPDLRHCPRAGTLNDEKQWRKVVRQQWKCVHEAWTPIFEQMGWSTQMPEVMFYPGAGSKSDCGYFEAPAFYCAANGGSVFFGGGHLKMAEQWNLSVNEMVNHEYGHHVQALAGISEAWTKLPDPEHSLVRRSELQAVCWSGMMTVHNDAVQFGPDDVDSWGERLRTMQESEQHGTRKSLVAWGTRGLKAKTIGDCNTWTVDDQRVR
ncbi:MAG: neutral zinc metallopeptidase [Propionibacteriaceae bacterium]|nr:neutral zinc metallopeptidase [Propionibacteriaceae bacterium]